MRTRIVGLAVLFLATGCHGTRETPQYGADGAGGATSVGGGGAGTPGGGSGASGTGATSTPPPGSAPTSLPFAVDDYYAPSGYMGDGELGGIVDQPACAARAGKARGTCHRVTWTPGSKGWAGIYWQYPDGNWGNAKGLALPPGAKQITFWAWGEKGGEKLTFFAGLDKADPFHAATPEITLTTTPTQYAVSLVGLSYDTVIGGFGWSTGTSDGVHSVGFSVDDIAWVEEAAVATTGCTDPNAANYDAGAGKDDGQCQYAVTFGVDMKAVALGPSDAVTLQASFNKWCGDCNPMADDDHDGTYTVTLPLAPGAHEYKFTTNGWSGQVEDVPLACDVTKGAQHNRGFILGKAPLVLPVVAWGTCPP